MSVFGSYSHYYNLLYKDKDYAAEALYVHQLIQKYFPGAKTVLNLGCGTGNHDFELAKFGYEITGVDMSKEMLAAAESRLSSSSVQPAAGSCSFLSGDIRTVRLNQTFDVVLSLFHVMSYQTTNSDLEAAIDSARVHLQPGGLFLFDFWYGPAVLTQKPEVRVKHLEDDDIQVTRIAEPVLHENENVVDVNYTVFITVKESSRLEQMRETHRIRYLFLPEIESELRRFGFILDSSKAWMTDIALSCDHWAGIVAASRDRLVQP